MIQQSARKDCDLPQTRLRRHKQEQPFVIAAINIYACEGERHLQAITEVAGRDGEGEAPAWVVTAFVAESTPPAVAELTPPAVAELTPPARR